MDINLLLQRIKIRADELGLKEATLSQNAVGNSDLIRNWRRAAEQGKPVSPQTDSIARVAGALGVSPAWLQGLTDDPSGGGPMGFAESDAVVFTARDARARRVIEALELGLQRPETWRLTVGNPWLGYAAGDLLVLERGRGPVAGEVVLGTVHDPDTGRTVTVLRRYMPPWLIDPRPDGPGGDQIDDTGRAAVHGVVVASLRAPGLD